MKVLSKSCIALNITICWAMIMDKHQQLWTHRIEIRRIDDEDSRHDGTNGTQLFLDKLMYILITNASNPSRLELVIIREL
jgi:hypothetical protein